VEPVSELLCFNGINGTSGAYGLGPMTAREFSDRIVDVQERKPENLDQLEEKLKQDAIERILDVSKALLAKDRAERYAASRDTWLEALLEGLGAIPIHSLIKAVDSSLDRASCTLLVESLQELDHLSGDAAALAEQFESLIQEPESLLQRLQRLREQSIGLARNGVVHSTLLERTIRELADAHRDDPEGLAELLTSKKTLLVGELAELSSKSAWVGRALAPLSEAAGNADSWDALVDVLSQSELYWDERVPWNDLLNRLHTWLGKLADKIGHLVVIEGVDPTDLAQAGWGILFAARDSRVPELKKALQPLLALREAQAARDRDRFRVYESGQGYHPGDTARKFLGRHGADPSRPANPDVVPYYLLIVGSPAEIPFRFQYQLDVQYAVGRIDFGDDYSAYENYARSVVEAEGQDFALPARAVLFGVDNPDDRATSLSAGHLVKPLCAKLGERCDEWEVDAVVGEEATKAQLQRLMGGEDTPAFLFTASHGMEFGIDDPKGRQGTDQGALLCGDWPGPNAWRGEIPRDFYLSGDDLASEANLLGTIAFFFACYGAGTPLYDEFSKHAFKDQRETIAEQAFVAALPKAMLSLSKGGALAVIGHVERAWGTSFLGSGRGEQLAVFESAMERLLKAHPVGLAMEYFDGRYAALSTEVTALLEDIDFGSEPDPYELAGMWTANNDARGYVVIGDPAVRLRVAGAAQATSTRKELTGKAVGAGASVESPAGGEVLAKPDHPGITEQDWQDTPLSVKRYVKQLEGHQPDA
jgi:hypothetical protein